MRRKDKKIYGKGGERIGLNCACGNYVDDLTPDIRAVTCWICIAKAAAAPAMPKQSVKKSEEERPRGWQRRKEYLSPSGKTYSFGKEVTSNEPIKTTDIAPIKRSKVKLESVSIKNSPKRNNEKSREEPVKRKRGRPKGSKNKNIHSKHKAK